ncbi:substrate-binding periplasmic protein [Roseibium hamelinense]|nr:transporter substrate-binding domain-containing protein [Roseibium hamelinense]
MRFTTLLGMCGCFLSVSAQADTLKICDDQEGWPPYIYHPVENGRVNTDKIEGAAVEFMTAVFADAGIEYLLELLPWKRCMYEVASFGPSGGFEAFSNGSFTEERAATYLITKPLYETTSGLFYNPAYHPNGLDLMTVADTKKYKFCGVFGYAYENWVIGDIDTSAKSTELALKMVEAGRCDAVPTAIEPVLGSAAVGNPIVPAGLRIQTFETAENATYHIYISRASPRAEELRSKIDASIAKLRQDGTHAAIFDKYQTFRTSD